MSGEATARDPLVSVYVPTRNRAAMLQRAVESVLAQSFADFEVVVASDGSTDDTAEVVRALAHRDARVRLVESSEQRGACATRNAAIAAARGHLVTGLDDDDEFLPERLALLVAAHDDLRAFVCTREVVSTSQGRKVENPTAGAVTLGGLLHQNTAGNQVLARRDRVLDVGGFDEAFPAFQDYDLWVRLAKSYGDGFKLRNVTYVRHLEHEQRISASPHKRLRALELFVDKHGGMMDRRHLASMELLRKKVAEESLSFGEFVTLCNAGNWVPAVAQLVNSGPPWLVAAKERVGRLAARRGATEE